MHREALHQSGSQPETDGTPKEVKEGSLTLESGRTGIHYTDFSISVVFETVYPKTYENGSMEKRVLLFSHSLASSSFVTPRTEAGQAPFVRVISQARILEWVAISFSRGSSRCRD